MDIVDFDISTRISTFTSTFHFLQNAIKQMLLEFRDRDFDIYFDISLLALVVWFCRRYFIISLFIAIISRLPTFFLLIWFLPACFVLRSMPVSCIIMLRRELRSQLYTPQVFFTAVDCFVHRCFFPFWCCISCWRCVWSVVPMFISYISMHPCIHAFMHSSSECVRTCMFAPLAPLNLNPALPNLRPTEKYNKFTKNIAWATARWWAVGQMENSTGEIAPTSNSTHHK